MTRNGITFIFSDKIISQSINGAINRNGVKGVILKIIISLSINAVIDQMVLFP